MEKTQYRNRDDSNGFQDQITSVDSTTRRIFLFGNAGAKEKPIPSKYAEAVNSFLNEEGRKQDLLFFLGDNIHNSSFESFLNEEKLKQQLKWAKEFKGEAYFNPGEQEWKGVSLERLENMEDAVEDALDKEHFLPENGCPFEEVVIDDQTAAFFIDTQWYIENWNTVKHLNDDCQIKTREQLLAIIRDEVRKVRHKNVLLIMHHPLFSNGIHGGELSGEALTKPVAENVYIPVAGSIWTFLRTQGGLSKQDQFNPLMNELLKEIKSISLQAERVFVLSAHERSLQYIENGNVRQLISGTMVDTKGARLGKDGYFSSGQRGFAELQLYKDGSSKVLFYTFTEENGLQQVFKKESFQKPTPYPIDSLPKTFPKTQTATVYPKEDVETSERYEKFWGKHYRKQYGVEVEAPVGLIDTLYGGFRIERPGGGNQTQSLRLILGEDKEYNMRALAKDPVAFLKSAGYDELDGARYFSETIPEAIIKDFYTAAHPYGAFAIPRLAGAANLNHTHPKLFYIPKQKALGDFNDIHGDRLYMIVEKPDDDFNSAHMFSFNDDVESTQDLFEEIRKDESKYVDEEEYIRARVFDMLVGDWDRHEDQWRWAEVEKEDGTTEFVAIPRDRDQVFANFDGSFLAFLQKFMGSTRQFGKYGPDIEFIEGFSESAINLDRALIQRSDREEWLQQAKILQDSITPELVRQAFLEMPKEVHDDTWEQIQQDLLKRKENLPDIVNRYYDNFIRFQTLKGTDKDEIFVIERTSPDITTISAFRKIDGEMGDTLFIREYNRKSTEEIWLYGLDDDDDFIVKGSSAEKPIKIVLVGGLGEDTYNIENGRAVEVYDQKIQRTTVDEKGGARFRLNDIYENHVYDSEKRPGSHSVFGAKLSYNPDLGAIPSLKLGKQTLAFERNPFTTQYFLQADYFSLTQAADIKGELHFAHLFPEWNLKVKGRATTNNFTQNFFGIGNETANAAESYDANRRYLQYLQGGVSTYYQGEYGSYFEFGADYSFVDVSRNATANLGINDNTFQFVAALATYGYESLDDNAFPTRGMLFNTNLNANFFIEGKNDQTFTANPSITFFNAIDNQRRFVMETKASGQLAFGENIPFFQLAQLGGEENLRSYRLQRFHGKHAAFGRANFHYRLQPIKTPVFPLKISVMVAADTGRVWTPNESSEKWHSSYGGGIRLNMVSFFDTRVTYFTGEEGGRFAFSLLFGG
ncbi:outer membrane protein assembly factor [Flavobacteriaceae bacterium TK19130]|nr:outer membrane protein assembly factor [Thermobacterium salinum]